MEKLHAQRMNTETSELREEINNYWASESDSFPYPGVEPAIEQLYMSPDTFDDWDSLSVVEVAGAMYLQGEVPEVSARYTQMYAEFNDKYFGGGLPTYTVKAVYHNFRAEFTESVASHIDMLWQTIYLAMTQRLPMAALLCHNIAHVAVGHESHEKDWLAEMERLREAGAPVDPSEFGDRKFVSAREWMPGWKPPTRICEY